MNEQAGWKATNSADAVCSDLGGAGFACLFYDFLDLAAKPFSGFRQCPNWHAQASGMYN